MLDDASFTVCSILQPFTANCSISQQLQQIAVYHKLLHHIEAYYNLLQHIAEYYNLLQHIAASLPLTMSVGFIGAGRMAFAMIRGFINQKMVAPQQVIASDIDAK